MLVSLVSLPVITMVQSCFQSVISSLCTVLGCTDLIGNFAFTFPTRLIQMVSRPYALYNVSSLKSNSHVPKIHACKYAPVCKFYSG